ncbi:hypothetical protein [Streptomyces sp. NPDC060077]|uniref:hypothetical protein n=1 Tax=Streptomyces sp. NPDC060077 TaxID=3347052 RepID=UPI003659EDEC
MTGTPQPSGHTGRSGRDRPRRRAWCGTRLHTAAGTAEPSARARMPTGRRRHEEPEPQPWRSGEPPAGWFSSTSRRRGRRRR